jgi:hypothetical protein
VQHSDLKAEVARACACSWRTLGKWGSIAARNSGLSAAISPRHSNQRLMHRLWWPALCCNVRPAVLACRGVHSRLHTSCAVAQQQARGLSGSPLCAWRIARAWLACVLQHISTHGTRLCTACVGLWRYGHQTVSSGDSPKAVTRRTCMCICSGLFCCS